MSDMANLRTSVQDTLSRARTRTSVPTAPPQQRSAAALGSSVGRAVPLHRTPHPMADATAALRRQRYLCDETREHIEQLRAEVDAVTTGLASLRQQRATLERQLEIAATAGALTRRRRQAIMERTRHYDGELRSLLLDRRETMKTVAKAHAAMGQLTQAEKS